MEFLLAERNQYEQDYRRSRRISRRLFCNAEKRKSHTNLAVHYRYMIEVIDWRINQLNGKELTRPMPQPQPMDGGL